MHSKLLRATCRHAWLLMVTVCCVPDVPAAERFICESSGDTMPLMSGLDTDSADRAINNTRSNTPRMAIGISHGGYDHGYGLGYGFDRFDMDRFAYSTASANQELLKLIIDQQRQIDELSRRVNAPMSLICRPLSDSEVQRLDRHNESNHVLAQPTKISGQTMYPHVDFVEVFNAPATGARRTNTLRLGTPVHVYERRGEWVRITPDGTLPGWVRHALLMSKPYKNQ